MRTQITYFAYSRKESAYLVGFYPEIEFSVRIEGAEVFTNSSEENVRKYLERFDPEDEYDWFIHQVTFSHPMGAEFLHGLEV